MKQRVLWLLSKILDSLFKYRGTFKNIVLRWIELFSENFLTQTRLEIQVLITTSCIFLFESEPKKVHENPQNIFVSHLIVEIQSDTAKTKNLKAVKFHILKNYVQIYSSANLSRYWKCAIALHTIVNIGFVGCLPPFVIFPLMILPISEVYEPGQTVTFSCAAGFTLIGSATATCSGTTFMFDNIPAECIPSRLSYLHW